MPSIEWFKEWFDSPYYHQLYAHRDDAEAAGFIDLLLKKLNPPKTALLLDVACGRGRHAKVLANEGYDVTGIDLSFSNISFAKSFENDHLHFYQHDMRLPFWINFFDYAFNFFTSFGYFRTDREHSNAIRTIAQSLKPGGILVVDYLNSVHAEPNLVPETRLESNGTGFHITRWCDADHFFKKIVISDPQQKAPVEYTEVVAKFSLDDFKKMFNANGLVLQEVFGNYRLEEFDEKNSARMIMIAKKSA